MNTIRIDFSLRSDIIFYSIIIISIAIIVIISSSISISIMLFKGHDTFPPNLYKAK